MPEEGPGTTRHNERYNFQRWGGKRSLMTTNMQGLLHTNVHLLQISLIGKGDSKNTKQHENYITWKHSRVGSLDCKAMSNSKCSLWKQAKCCL